MEIGIGSVSDELSVEKGSAEARGFEEDFEVRKSFRAEGVQQILHLDFGREKSSRGAGRIGVGSCDEDDASRVAQVGQIGNGC